jgi:hypothetical protein
VSQDAGDRVTRLLEQEAALQTEARRWLSPAQQAALAGTEANIALLGERLRKLHGEQNGLQLD